MNINITKTFIITITLLNRADSLIPITKRIVIAATMNIAGRFIMAVRCGKVSTLIPVVARLVINWSVIGFQPASGILTSTVPIEDVNSGGIFIPKSL